MKAKKIAKNVGIGLLVVILVISLVVHFAGDAALKAGIEAGASKALGVNVSVGKISFSILGGKVKIKDMVIDNPEGYQHEKMLVISDGYVDVAIMSLLSDTVEIKTVKFDGIDMVLEQKGFTSNLKEIMNNLPASDGPSTKPSPAPGDEPAKEAKNLLISELEISNVTVKAKLLPIPGKLDTITIKIDPIVMKDLGSDDKMSMSRLTGKILAAIATGIAGQGAGLLPKDMIGDINNMLKDKGGLVLDKSKLVLDETKVVGGDVIDAGKELGEEVGGIIKGLFGK